MLVAILIFLIFLVIAILIAFIIYHFISKKSTNKIGLNYKPGVSKEFDTLVYDIQKLVNMFENSTCKEVKTFLASEVYRMFLDQASQISCDELRKEIDVVAINNPEFKQIVNNILNQICSGSNMDKSKLEKTVINTYSSMCFQEW